MGRDERNNLRGLPGGLPVVGGGNRAALQPLEIRDSLNRVIHENDAVILQTQHAQLFRVASIKQVLEPGAPAGLMDIVLQSTAVFRAARGSRNAEFLRVVQAREGQPAPPSAETPGEEPPPEEPPA